MASRTLILSDGSIAGLFASANAREAHMLSGGAADRVPGVMPFVTPLDSMAAAMPALMRHARLQAEALGLAFVPPPEVFQAESLGLGEAVALLAAAYRGVAAGYDTIVWPASGAIGEAVDLGRVATIADRALLASRLVAIDAAAHDTPGIRIETPFADLTDGQLADLALDINAPLDTCWWWGGQGVAAMARERWMAALHGAGLAKV